MSLFGIDATTYKLWASKKYYQCQSGMMLWIGIESLRIDMDRGRTTREQWKKIVQEYPYDTRGCRCKACRYRRLFK